MNKTQEQLLSLFKRTREKDLTTQPDIDIVDLLHQVKQKHPYLRVGQIVEVALSHSGYKGDVFMIPDAILAKGLNKIIVEDN